MKTRKRALFQYKHKPITHKVPTSILDNRNDLNKTVHIMGKILSLSLAEIGEWQINPKPDNSVSLPSLQRNFVWKSNQIETIWDSILRGFPLGSFLLSEKENDDLFLLDGQQRSTSIALGFNNPWTQNENAFWSLKDTPVLWIDLMSYKSDKNPIGQVLSIRALTKSHPWGYQQKENSKPLTVRDRKSSLSIFKSFDENKEKPYINFDKRYIFPYESELPVPLSFLLEIFFDESIVDWSKALIEYCKKYLKGDKICTKHYEGVDYLERLETFFLDNKNLNIYNQIRKNVIELKIPGIVVNKDILKTDDNDNGSQNPTLFIRLNSAGTTLNGEELIYSIYKATFEDSKELVDSIGANFLRPSAVINIVSRLAWAEVNDNNYPYTISVRDFRIRIQNEGFRDKLSEWINSSEHVLSAKDYFNRLFLILSDSNDKNSIPIVLLKSLLSKNSELILLFIKYIKAKNNILDAFEIKKIRSLFISFAWFSSDTVKLSQLLWHSMSADFTWQKKDLKNIIWENGVASPLAQIIEPSFLKEVLFELIVEKGIHWNDLYPSKSDLLLNKYKEYFDLTNEELPVDYFNEVWDKFIVKLYRNKGMILYAQREYINREFEEFNQIESLTDTDTPWDWDHIYPNSWIKSKQNIHHITKSWNDSIGNYRALALSQNRSIHDDSPNKRLSGPDKDSFIFEEDYFYWKTINCRINDNNTDLVRNHISAILVRMTNIYKEWYDSMRIGDLF